MTRNFSLPAVFIGTLAVIALATVASGSVAADSEYEISASESVDTPTRDVNLRGATYQISALGKASPGGSIDLEINAPQDNQFYRVYLYNSSETIVARESGTGDATLTFDLENREPGTYMFALQEQGTTQVIYPLVIQAYSMNLDTPDQVSAGDSLTAEISLTQTSTNSPPDRVEVVVAGQSSQITESASEDGDSYTATISSEPLGDGTYLVYANARGSNVVYNEQEIFGVSSTNEVTVGTSGSNDDGTTDDGTTDDRTTDDDNQSTSGEPSGEIQDPESTEELPEVGSSDENSQSESESSDEGSQSDTGTQSDSSSTIPGFTIELVILSLILTAVLLSSRE